jgi:aquaporin Z
VAFGAEALITFVLMSVILVVSNYPRWARWTGLCAGLLVAVYITVEAPLSGMSMNPARTLGPVAFTGDPTALWIYFVAPALGMLAAAEVYVWRWGREAVFCAKLCHAEPCRFCEWRLARGRPSGAAEGGALSSRAQRGVFSAGIETEEEDPSLRSG